MKHNRDGIIYLRLQLKPEKAKKRRLKITKTNNMCNKQKAFINDEY